MVLLRSFHNQEYSCNPLGSEPRLWVRPSHAQGSVAKAVAASTMPARGETVMRMVIPSQGAGLEDPVAATNCQVIALLFGKESSGHIAGSREGKEEKKLRAETSCPIRGLN